MRNNFTSLLFFQAYLILYKLHVSYLAYVNKRAPAAAADDDDDDDDDADDVNAGGELHGDALRWS